jgi:hypothetical protein
VKRVTVSSRVERLEAALGRMHAIPLPDFLPGDLGLETHYRVIVEISGVELNRAILAPKSGQPYLIIGLQTLHELGLQEGSPIEMTLRADPNPTTFDVAEELLEALAQDDEARERWESFTPGKRRSLNHYVDSAKRPETRIRRAVELTEKIRTRTLYGD